MRKLFFLFAIVSFSLAGFTQTKVTPELALSICAQEMAAFTKSVAPAYQKGSSYQQFQFALCGKSQPTIQGANQLKVAYNFLTQGVTNDFIIRNYKGKEVAETFKYLADNHNKGFDSDGAELFGGKTGTANSNFAKSASGDGCRWYQVWCHVQVFANWVVANWDVIKDIIAVIITLLP